MRLLSLLVVFTTLLLLATSQSNPYPPSAGWSYYIEAVRGLAWPSCAYRFVSRASCSATSRADYWREAGINQEWVLVNAGNGNFHLKAPNCEAYLSYTSDCSQTFVDIWNQAGGNQAFRLVVDDNTQTNQYYLEAVGRGGCAARYFSFYSACSTGGPDALFLSSTRGRFRLTPAHGPSADNHFLGSNGGCADPFAWYDPQHNNYKMTCTGGGISIFSANDIGTGVIFNWQGLALKPPYAGWANYKDHWAGENFYTPRGQNVIFVSDRQMPSNVHRLGYIFSETGALPDRYDKYSPNYLPLSNTKGGEIDAHVFHDAGANKYYLLWKSDDNHVGDRVTRLWGQEITFPSNNVVGLVGTPRVLMDSSGLWWSISHVAGGSLIEGPQMVKHGRFYYLFFASGKYCHTSYAEGVARSTSFWGPYEKQGVPFMNTPMVGTAWGTKLMGPGHASFLQNKKTGDWWAVWHASIGDNCDRQPFISKVIFNTWNEWPILLR